MLIGIDASRAFIKDRTGIEEYSYQVIKNLRDKLDGHQVVLYLRNNQKVDFEIPQNWTIKVINFYYFWTQIGLSLEILFHPVDTLFIPAHTVPLIHPKNTVVTIHGLEYEFCPSAYSFWERLYMRQTIKKSCQWAKSIIAVSENTKKDLMKLYAVQEEKIEVIYEGCTSDKRQETRDKENQSSHMSHVTCHEKYLLFIGRLEERKNIVNIINAFEILKEQYKIPHKLVLAGKSGFGYEKIQKKIQETRDRKQIILTGFVNEEEKQELLKKAAVFVFPTLYEGFGLPILEAQNAGIPVVASIESSIPEVAGEGALLVDPNNAEDIADAVYKIISDEKTKQGLIQKGIENVKRFSWSKCAKEIAEILEK